MTKLVRYNGQKENWLSCEGFPENLVVNQLYEVVYERDLGAQTNYVLKGLRGDYNSCWFDDLPAYIATSKNKPVKGKIMTHFNRFIDGRWQTVEKSSNIVSIETLGKDLYQVYTKNTCYILQVI